MFVLTYAMLDEQSIATELADLKISTKTDVEVDEQSIATELADLKISTKTSDSTEELHEDDGHECGDVKRLLTQSHQPNVDRTDAKAAQPQAPKKSGALSWFNSLCAPDTSPLPTLNDINAFLKTRLFIPRRYGPVLSLQLEAQHEDKYSEDDKKVLESIADGKEASIPRHLKFGYKRKIFCVGTSLNTVGSIRECFARIEYTVGINNGLKSQDELSTSIWGISFHNHKLGEQYAGIEHLLLYAALMDAWHIDPVSKEINYLHSAGSFDHCAAKAALKKAGLTSYSPYGVYVGMKGDLKIFVEKHARKLFKTGRELFTEATTAAQ